MLEKHGDQIRVCSDLSESLVTLEDMVAWPSGKVRPCVADTPRYRRSVCVPYDEKLNQCQLGQWPGSGFESRPARSGAAIVVGDFAFLMSRARVETNVCFPGYLGAWGLRHIILNRYIWPILNYITDGCSASAQRIISGDSTSH